MTRQEHMDWCKQRALAELKESPQAAFASMISDLNKHTETAGHAAIQLGLMLMMAGGLDSVEKMREFIEGFN